MANRSLSTTSKRGCVRMPPLNAPFIEHSEFGLGSRAGSPTDLRDVDPREPALPRALSE